MKYFERSKIGKCHQSFKYKDWWRNIDNQTMDYQHIGEEFHMRTIHMNHKCSIDRLRVYPYILKW